MATIPQSCSKLVLECPLEWSYKIIIHADADIKIILKNILHDRPYQVRASNSSKSGKYQSHNLTLIVHNDDDRQMIYEQLKKDINVKVVL